MKKLLSAVRDTWIAIGIVLLLVAASEVVPSWIIDLRKTIKYGDVSKPDFRADAESYEGADWVAPYWREYFSIISARWAPYVHWRLRPVSGEFIHVGEDGNRRTWTPEQAADAKAAGTPPAGDDKLKIFVFGSSNLFGMGARDDGTIPSYLAKGLAARGVSAEVRNFGQPGWASTQDMIQFILELKAGHAPDLAIFYGGAPDANSVRITGIVGDPPNRLNREREFNLVSGGRNGDLVKEATLSLIPRLTRRANELSEFLGLRSAVPARPFPDERIPDFADRIVQAYEQNVRIIRALAAEHGVRTLFFWQPLVYFKDHLSPYEKRHQALATWPALYKALAPARENSAYLSQMTDAVDLSNVFDETETGVFVDFTHLTEKGNAIVAAAMLPHVLARLPGAGGKGD